MSHLISSLLSEIKNHSSEHNSHSFGTSCSTRLWKDAKLEVGKDTNLIHQAIGDVINWNVLAFTRSSAGDMQANLLAVEDIANIEKTKNLLCFAFDNRKKDEGTKDLLCFASDSEKKNKVPLKVIDLAKEKNISTDFFR